MHASDLEAIRHIDQYLADKRRRLSLSVPVGDKLRVLEKLGLKLSLSGRMYDGVVTIKVSVDELEKIADGEALKKFIAAQLAERMK